MFAYECNGCSSPFWEYEGVKQHKKSINQCLVKACARTVHVFTLEETPCHMEV